MADKLRKHYKQILRRNSNLSDEKKREVARNHIEVMASALRKGFSFNEAHDIAENLREDFEEIWRDFRNEMSEEQARKHIKVMVDAIKKGFSFNKAYDIAEEVHALMIFGHSQKSAYDMTMSRGQLLADFSD